jgi:hypothetical protein
MDLFAYYSLDECTNRKSVNNRLKSLKNDGKIEYDVEDDILQINDIDLEDADIEQLTELFDKTDVFPYLDYDGESEDEDGFKGDYDSEDEDDF